MARARNIKPSLFKNEILGESDPYLTILFQGLWCLADREGRLEYRPKRIKAEIFPYRETLDINGYLTELERLGFILKYCVENTQYLLVKNFTKHQSPHKTEKASNIPPPPSEAAFNGGSSNNGSLTVKEPNDNGSCRPDLLIPDSLYKPHTTARARDPDPLSEVAKRNQERQAKASESHDPYPPDVWRNHSGSEKHRMFDGWQPEMAELPVACAQSTINLDDVTQESIGNLINFFITHNLYPLKLCL